MARLGLAESVGFGASGRVETLRCLLKAADALRWDPENREAVRWLRRAGEVLRENADPPSPAEQAAAAALSAVLDDMDRRTDLS